MDGTSPIFEKTYQNYLALVNRLDLKEVSQKTGTQWTGKSLIIPLFGKPYRISKSGILDPSGNTPAHSINVVLCQYLLRHPAHQPDEDTWVSYKDFRDAAPLVNFHANSEMSIAGRFGGRLEALNKTCSAIGGYDYSEELNYDLRMKFDALPRIPILLLFNDSDDEFPARCLLLFERRSEQYLDMECLAILGGLLAENLSTEFAG